MFRCFQTCIRYFRPPAFKATDSYRFSDGLHWNHNLFFHLQSWYIGRQMFNPLIFSDFLDFLSWWFFTDSDPLVNHHHSPSFGRLFFYIFPSIEPANPSDFLRFCMEPAMWADTSRLWNKWSYIWDPYKWPKINGFYWGYFTPMELFHPTYKW